MAVELTGSSTPSATLQQVDRFDVEAGLETDLAEQVDVALTVATEVEVLADHDRRRGEAVDQHSLDERLRATRRPAPRRRARSRAASTPVASSSSIFSSGPVSSCGADAGRTTVAGCLSNVTTADRHLRSAASRRTCSMTAW